MNRKSLFLALVGVTLKLFVYSQSYIPYGGYASASAPFGQTALRYQLASNVLYSATNRFDVTATSSGTVNLPMLFDGNYSSLAFYVPAASSGTITIDFTAKGGGAISYPGGDVYVSFYYQNTPASVTGRLQKTDGTWYDLTSWTNISTQSNLAVWKGHSTGSYNYAKILEITITANSGNDAIASELEFVMDRPGQYEDGLVTKFSNQTLYHSLSWRNSNNAISGTINNDGSLFITGNMGVGLNTIPTARMEISSTSTAGFAQGFQNNLRLIANAPAMQFWDANQNVGFQIGEDAGNLYFGKLAGQSSGAGYPLILWSNQSVGIGSLTMPTEKLYVRVQNSSALARFEGDGNQEVNFTILSGSDSKRTNFYLGGSVSSNSNLWGIKSNDGNGRFSINSGSGNEVLTIMQNGKVGIGVANPEEALTVNGNVVAERLRVKPVVWPDFVFSDNYQLPTLDSLANYLKLHRHLPGLPSHNSVEQFGIDVGVNQAALLQKIEELTLYIIDLQKQVNELKEKAINSQD